MNEIKTSRVEKHVQSLAVLYEKSSTSYGTQQQRSMSFRSDTSVLEILVSTCTWVPPAQTTEQVVTWMNPLAK